jgi:hypothetical protein
LILAAAEAEFFRIGAGQDFLICPTTRNPAYFGGRYA